MTITDEMREKACCEALNSYLFHNIWNEPSAEFRDNIRPTTIRKKTLNNIVFDNSFTGSFSLPDANITLPTEKEPYYVWCISTSNFHVGLQIPTNEWISTAELANKYGTLFHVYTVHGHMFAKGFTYVYMNTSRSNLLICAKKHMTNKFLKYIEQYNTEDIQDPNRQLVSKVLEDIYITVYYDSDNSKDIHVLSLYIDGIYKSVVHQNFNQQINNYLAQCTNIDQLSVFRNGIEVTGNTLLCPVLENSTYLDFIIDENVEFTFDIDLVKKNNEDNDPLSGVSGNQDPVYKSSRDGIWKQLIHIPKSKNPNNYIITHNTCDFFVRRKYEAGEARSDTYGLYLHRASTNRKCIYQVTHNDMSVPLMVIEAYRDAKSVGDQEVYLHGIVRMHDKKNVLTPDSSYINLLYSDVHSDTDIIRILCGNGPVSIPWWKASNLEQSAYVQMMFDTPNFTVENPTGTQHMQTYVDSIGFYQTMNILCKRIVDTVITDSFTGELTFNLPILYYGLKVIPILYLNGKYIPRDYISYKNYPETNRILIKLSSDYYTRVGDKLTAIFFVSGDTDAILFEPTAANLRVDVPYKKVVVYEVMDNIIETKDLQGNVHTTGYYKRTVDNSVYISVENDIAGGNIVAFNDSLVGNKFLIESAYCSYFKQYNLDSYLETGDSIIIPLETNLKSGGTAPILNYENISVYLNNIYLVRDLDYTIHSCKNNEGYYINTELVIQTLDHFRDENNTLDVLINVANIEDISTGFMIDNTLQDKSPVNLYYNNISMVHIDGQIERNIDYKGIYVKMPENKYPQGSIFEVQTAVPSLVKDFINKYSSNEDYQRIVAMNEYFYDFLYTEPDFIVLENQHKIYSIYMNNFIQDIVTGKIALADDPDMKRMLQQIRPYNYLKEADICYQDVDKRFMDFYPGLVNRQVDPKTKHLIDRIIREFMPSNEDVQELDTVYDN